MATARRTGGAVRAMLDRWRERGRRWQGGEYYPAFLDLRGRRCLVVGAGPVGEGKIGGLLRAGAAVRAVSKTATEAVMGWAGEGLIELELRPFRPGDLDGCFLAIAATEDSELNTAVFEGAEARRMLCNVVDVPRLCSFILPSIHRDGDLAIAISTGGASPALARKIRLELGARYGPEHAEALELLGALREEAKRAWPGPGDRKVIFERLVYAPAGPDGARLLDLVRAAEAERIEAWVERCLAEGPGYAPATEHAATVAEGLAAAGADPESADPSH